MTADQLCRAQEILGLTSTELAELTGRSRMAVWKWRNGITPVPGYAETLIRERLAVYTHCDPLLREP